MLTNGEIRVEMCIQPKAPPIMARIKEKFPDADWERGIAICYGEKIYCKYKLTDDVLAHELVHVRQQKEIGRDIWWDKYLEDAQFRLEQELEAYGTQVKYIREHTERTTRNQRRMMIDRIADTLSGELYGHMISYEQAKKFLLI